VVAQGQRQTSRQHRHRWWRCQTAKRLSQAGTVRRACQLPRPGPGVVLQVQRPLVAHSDEVSARHGTPHHIASHRIASHRITSHHITSHHITSHHITSHHITSHHITSHHITAERAHSPSQCRGVQRDLTRWAARPATQHIGVRWERQRCRLTPSTPLTHTGPITHTHADTRRQLQYTQRDVP
jgi:hypothetical protein